MKLNLINSQSVGPSHYFYIPPSQLSTGDDECQEIAPESPHYQCTRQKGHVGDCAAHGNSQGNGYMPGMFARWSRDEIATKTREERDEKRDLEEARQQLVDDKVLGI